MKVPVNVGFEHCNRTSLRRREAGWRATGGEWPVRRIMTNSIRPNAVASQLGNGEAQDARVPRGMWMAGRPCHAVSPGEKPNQTPGTAAGWLETEWLEGSTQEARRPDGDQTRHFGRNWHQGIGQTATGPAGGPRRDRAESARKHKQTGATPETTRPAGVRASIVATKPGNSGGAKGRREMDEE